MTSSKHFMSAEYATDYYGSDSRTWADEDPPYIATSEFTELFTAHSNGVQPMDEVLAEHRTAHVIGYAIHCACDPEVGYSPDRFFAHQSDALQAAGYGSHTQVKAQVLRDAADWLEAVERPHSTASERLRRYATQEATK